MSLVYRARPIDRAGNDTFWHVVLDAVDLALRDQGHLVYRPEGAWLVGPDTTLDPRLEQLNRQALDAADCVVALLPPGIPTLGVGREIEAARAMGTPVVVVADGNLWSASDCDRFPFSSLIAPKVATWASRVQQSDPTIPLRFLALPQFPDALLPTRRYEGDAAFDLYVAERTVVAHNAFVDVPCGVRMALPPGVFARITGRSSTLRNRGLLVVEGVLDQGYRGPLFAGVQNVNGKQVVLEAGERIAQVILHDLVADQFTAVWSTPEQFDAVPGDGRGERGFGSTGG